MVRIDIGRNDAGQRVDKFITKAFPSLPQSAMYKAIREKNVKLNRKRCEISTRLREGDVLELYIRDELLGTRRSEEKCELLLASKALSAVYEDGNIIIADKPAGVIVHPDEQYQTDTLIARIQRYLYEKGEYDPADEHSFAPALANRIDRNTAGLVIAAKNAEALRVLNEKIKAREIDKRYLCIVHGVPEKREQTLEGFLEKNESQNRVYIEKKAGKNTRTIRTHYRVIAASDELSLLEVELLTGRTHQIRAHMASIGHPLLGDGKYGENRLNRKYGAVRQMLYSYKLTFTFPTDAGALDYLRGRTVEVSVPFAEEFLSRPDVKRF